METVTQRTNILLKEQRQAIYRRTDKIFVGLMLFQWIGAIAAACFISPNTWEGSISSTHIHVWAAIFLGGALTVVPVYFALRWPGDVTTRHIIAAGQMLMSSLLIHLAGGRIEAHFHVFGSLAFLAFYRDWRVLISASAIVAADHYFRGVYWPQSAYGVLVVSPWRWLEHAFWVIFEDVFLIVSIQQSQQEMYTMAARQAAIEDLAINKTHELQLQKQALDQAMLVSVVDTQGLIVYANDKFCEVSKYSREELLGQDHRIVNSGTHPKSFWKELWETITKGKIWRGEVCNRAKDGSIYWVDTVVVPSLGLDGKPIKYLSVRMLITERKRAEEAARRSEKMSAVGKLAAGVAHEINNPLGVILGFAEGALRRLEAGNDLEMPLQSIHREALRCKSLVQDLLTFSRVSKVEREPMDFNKVVEGALSLVAAKARMSQVVIQKELAPSLPSFLGNPNQIQQVIINLATNAIDAMDGQGTLSIKTEVIVEESLSWIDLRVTDTGAGIPQEVIPHIFEPFYTTKPLGQGTGLGLALIHEIVTKHSAFISVESCPGRTEFRIQFPVRTGCEMVNDAKAPGRSAKYAA